MNWPSTWKTGTQKADAEASITETWAKMEALVDTSAVRQLGVANCGLQDMEVLLEAARVKPVCDMVELHPLLSQRKLVGTLLRKVR
jgi:diketogulonate reductase-like aldo/keto reductase